MNEELKKEVLSYLKDLEIPYLVAKGMPVYIENLVNRATLAERKRCAEIVRRDVTDFADSEIAETVATAIEKEAKKL